MKLFTKLLMLAVVLAVAAPFILKKPDGTPWLSFSDLLARFSSSAPEAVKDLVNDVGSKTEKVYRWQDASGKWHFSDTPVSGVQQEQVEVKQSVNRLKQIDLPEGFGDGKKEKSFDPTEKSGSPGLPLTTAPLEKVPEMLNKIEDVQKRMDERQKLLESLD